MEYPANHVWLQEVLDVLLPSFHGDFVFICFNDFITEHKNHLLRVYLVYSPLFIIISNSLSHGPCMDHWRGDFCFVLTWGRLRSALTPAAWALLTQKQASTACCSKELIPWKRLDEVRWTSTFFWNKSFRFGMLLQHETTMYRNGPIPKWTDICKDIWGWVKTYDILPRRHQGRSFDSNTRRNRSARQAARHGRHDKLRVGTMNWNQPGEYQDGINGIMNKWDKWDQEGHFFAKNWAQVFLDVALIRGKLSSIWGFPEMGIPQIDRWFIIENPMNIDDLGVIHYEYGAFCSMIHADFPIKSGDVPVLLRWITRG